MMEIKKKLCLFGGLFFIMTSWGQESELNRIVKGLRQETKTVLDLDRYESDEYQSARFIPIMMDGKIVGEKELNTTDLEEISEIRLVFNDTITALFGGNGSQGVIIIEKLKPRRLQKQE